MTDSKNALVIKVGERYFAKFGKKTKRGKMVITSWHIAAAKLYSDVEEAREILDKIMIYRKIKNVSIYVAGVKAPLYRYYIDKKNINEWIKNIKEYRKG